MTMDGFVIFSRHQIFDPFETIDFNTFPGAGIYFYHNTSRRQLKSLYLSTERKINNEGSFEIDNCNSIILTARALALEKSILLYKCLKEHRAPFKYHEKSIFNNWCTVLLFPSGERTNCFT